MSQLWCLDCQKPFDALQGHDCVNSWCIPVIVNRNDANLQTIVDKQDGISQLIPHVTEELSNPPTSISNGLGNSNPEFSVRTSLNDLATNSNDQLTHSSQECAQERISDQLVIVNSEQAQRRDYADKEIKKSENCKKNYEFAMASGSVDHLISNKNRTDTPSEEHSTIQNYRPILKNNEALRRHEYEISGVSNEIPFIYNEEKRLNIEFAMQGIVNDDKMAATDIGLAEMNGQFPKCGQLLHLGGQEESTATPIPNPGTSDSIQPCSADDALAVAGPSCSQDSAHTCPLCLKEFRSKKAMKKHYKIHSGERPFICHICQNGFTLKENLNRHMLRHSGEKPHKCGRTFARKQHLQRHNRSRHNVAS